MKLKMLKKKLRSGILRSQIWHKEVRLVKWIRSRTSAHRRPRLLRPLSKNRLTKLWVWTLAAQINLRVSNLYFRMIHRRTNLLDGRNQPSLQEPSRTIRRWQIQNRHRSKESRTRFKKRLTRIFRSSVIILKILTPIIWKRRLSVIQYHPLNSKTIS